jgi:hypothetical protein
VGEWVGVLNCAVKIKNPVIKNNREMADDDDARLADGGKIPALGQEKMTSGRLSTHAKSGRKRCCLYSSACSSRRFY